MPRTLDDATRFTATFPHAHSKPSFASTINVSTPPPNETPAQKVARLREAARRARIPHESTFDKVVRRGRYVADKAHKTVTASLIGLSLVAFGFASLSLGEMVIHNSRKKKEWMAIQIANYERAVTLARKAEAEGTLTPDLKLFLNNERAIEEAEKAKIERGSLWQRIKQQTFGGLAMEDQPGGAMGAVASRLPKELKKENQGIADAVGAQKDVSPPAMPVSTAVTHTTENEEMKTPGALDVLGGNVASSLSSQTSKWTSWLGWR